jgi:hypothetical protein
VSTGSAGQDPSRDAQHSLDVATRGRDWALDRKKPSAVPIRRTIQVVVRDDHVAILADGAPINTAAPRGKRIALPGDTVESVDEFVTAVRQHVEGWGIAGEGLYWRPVLVLTVGPDGGRRAEDLNRLLHNSGLELRTPQAAHSNPQDRSRATR